MRNFLLGGLISTVVLVAILAVAKPNLVRGPASHWSARAARAR